MDYSALHAIGFATGAALSGLLWSMQRRVDRAGGASGFQILWIVGFIWTVGNFLQSLPLADASVDVTTERFAATLAWSCTILGPFAIGRFLQAGIGANRVSRRFLMFTAAVSVLNCALLVTAGVTHGFDINNSWYPEASLYVALVVTAIAMILYAVNRGGLARKPEQSTPRWLGRTALWLCVFQVTAALLSGPNSWLPADLRMAAILISAHWAIPWSILIAVSLAQAHFADLVLKRSLWLIASVLVSAVISVFVLDVAPGLPMLISTLGVACLILVAPSLVRAVNFVVDRMLLRRGDYVATATAFEESVRKIYDQERLFDMALRTIKSTLRVEARLVPDGTASARALASIPIQSEGRPTLQLEITGTHQGRTLMHEEVTFLNAIVTQVSRRLEAAYFEQEQRVLLMREERLKRLLIEAELKALRTQVDPHFLFNTLNTIADLIGSNPSQAERMTERLAECFRYALASHSRTLSTLNDELEFARHYLEIEQVRFGERLRVHLSRGDASGNEPLPSLLLQPLLENAIRHGLAPLREGGCVRVVAKREGEYLRLQVDDDGVGLSDCGKQSGVGLQNVKERLATLYSRAASLAIARRADGRGTSVTILVPLNVT